MKDIESMIIRNPLRCARIMPNLTDIYVTIKEPLSVRVKRIALRILKIVSILLLLIIIISIGTVLIMKYIPDAYPLYLLFTFVLGALTAGLIFDM